MKSMMKVSLSWQLHLVVRTYLVDVSTRCSSPPCGGGLVETFNHLIAKIINCEDLIISHFYLCILENQMLAGCSTWLGLPFWFHFSSTVVVSPLPCALLSIDDLCTFARLSLQHCTIEFYLQYWRALYLYTIQHWRPLYLCTFELSLQH